MSSTLSTKRQRQILGLLLTAFALLMLVSLATYQAPLPYAAPWSAANACGPVGAFLGFLLVWVVGRVAAFGVPVLAAAWAWNRLRGAPGGPVALRSGLGALLVFELCGLAALGGLDRTTWTGSWGFASALALRAALGNVGSWVVGGALFGITLLAASEFGFHWVGDAARRLLLAPLLGVAQAFRGWSERLERAPKIARPAKPRAPRPAPAASAGAEAEQNGRPRIMTASAAEPRLPQLSLDLPGEKRPKPAREAAPKPRPALKGGAAAAAALDELPSLDLLGMPAQPEDLITAADLTARGEPARRQARRLRHRWAA